MHLCALYRSKVCPSLSAHCVAIERFRLLINEIFERRCNMLGFHSSGIYNGVLSSIYSDADILLAIAAAASRERGRRRRGDSKLNAHKCAGNVLDKCSTCRDGEGGERGRHSLEDRKRDRQRERDGKSAGCSKQPLKLPLDPPRRSSRLPMQAVNTRISIEGNSTLPKSTQLNSTELFSFHIITDQFTASVLA